MYTEKISVIVPCFNEEGNVKELVERVIKNFEVKKIEGEIILIDDKSTDKTSEKINQMVQKYSGKVKAIFHEKNQGMEGAWNSGLKNASGPLVCIIDADLQYLPEDIERLFAAYEESGADCVQGCRSSIGRERGGRYTLSVVLNTMLNLSFGMTARDNKSGFLLTRKEVLEDIFFHKFNYFFFQTFLTVAAHKKSYSIKEVEVLFDKRRVGESFLKGMPLISVCKTFSDITKAFVEYNFLSKQQIFLDKYLNENKIKINEKSEKWSLFRRAYLQLYAITMPLHHWMIARPAIRYFWILRKTQWLSLEEINKIQVLKLRKMIEHSYRHVPYYKKLLDSLGLKPADINSIEDLQKLPLLDKPTIRKNLYFDLFSDNHDKNKISRISTSGSTGEPFVCYADKKQLEMRWASTLRSQEWTGYKFGDRCVRLWHQTIGMSKVQIIKEYFDALFSRRKFIPAFNVSDKNITNFVASITDHNPTLIDGYAESFNFLASYLKNNKLKNNSLKGIMSSAQTLSQQSRDIIEDTFNTKVYDKYGSREFSGIAYECSEHGGHHVVAESYIVEIIKDGRLAKHGETGEVVITDLNNFCMPFIRYRVGDIAVATNDVCKCGRGLPLIGDIQGRTQSIIFGAENQYVPGSFFAHLFKEYDHAIKQFQVEQSQMGSITLRVVKAGRYNDEVLQDVLSHLKNHLGEKMNITVDFVDTIPLGRTGKYQHSISKLNLEFQDFANKNVKLKNEL